MRSERVALYIVSSILIALAGLLVLVISPSNNIAISIGTSLIAGGLASVGFAVIRYLDDRAADSSASSIKESVEALRHTLQDQQTMLESLRRVSSTIAESRVRIYDRHPQDEVGDEMASSPGVLTIDVMGLTLRAFCQDWLSELASRGNCTLRLLTQDPAGKTFEQVCHQESRDIDAMRADALWVARRCADASKKGAETFSVEVRWHNNFPTVTMTRVNHVLFVRSRFLREATQPRLFHERYAVEDGIPFVSYVNEFERAWELSRGPHVKDVPAIGQADS